MKFEIEGKVVTVMATKQVSQTFSKREFVIETEDGKYSQILMFEATGKAIDYLDDVKNGDRVNVHFNLRGREWRSPQGETKYFNSLNAWKVEPLAGEKRTEARPSSSAPAAPPPPADDPFGTPVDDSDIPF